MHTMQLLPVSRLILISFLATVFFMGAVVLSACGSFGGSAPPTPTVSPISSAASITPTATPEPLGGNLTIRMADSVPILRPWQPRSRSEEQIIDLLYSGLVRLDPQLRPEPDLATEWETSPDGRVLTFTLRTDVTWHDGEPFDGEDVLFTLERMRSLPFTQTALLANLRYINAVSVPLSNTVVFSLTERYAPLISEMALPILPSHALEGRDLGTLNFWDAPVGTGPFLFENRIPGQSVVLSRHAGYHHGEPLLERVAFVGASDTEVTLEALQAENLLLAELPWSAARGISETVTTVRTGYYPENGFYFLGFNLREGRPFADVRVRRALALAMDVPRLTEVSTQGQGIPVSNSAAPGSWADLTTPPASGTNLQVARDLLNEAGWVLPPGTTIRQREGEPFSATLYVRGDDERRLIAAQQIAEAGSRIGLQINVEPADFGSVIVPKYAPPYDFDLLLGSWLNGAGDPGFGDYLFYDPDDFSLFHSSEIVRSELDTRNTRNFVAFSNPVYDEEAQAGRQLYDVEDRIAAYRETQDIIAEELPYIFLWTDRIPVVLNRRVTTLDGPVNLNTPMYLWNIERWYVE